MTELEDQFKWYLANQSQLVEKYNGRWVVIHAEKVESDFDTELDAYTFAVSKFKPGEFLIQNVSPGEGSYTQTFHSRVVI
jgi:hypothetical protein